jgi:cell division septation protein DedD
MSGGRYDDWVMPQRRSPAALAVALVAALVVSACAATPPPTNQSSSPTSSPTAELTPVPGGSTAESPALVSPPTQTDTEWGRIWDALPPGFPLPQDAVPTETGEGPASASLAVGAAAPNVASFMQNALTGAGFSIESVEGPSEDGSFTINAVGPDTACQAQVRVRPLSGTTNVVVMYGAACPFE